MDYLVESREMPARLTMARRARLPVDRIGSWLAESYALISSSILRAGVPIVGPAYARFAFAGSEADVEAGVPVAASIPPAGDVVISALPAVTAAVTTHRGPYERLQDAYKAVSAWIAENGGEPLDGHWEFYHDDPAQQPDSTRWRTDVVVPYRSRAIGGRDSEAASVWSARLSAC